MATPGSLVILVGLRNQNVLHRKSDLIVLNVLRFHQFIKTYGSGQNSTNQNWLPQIFMCHLSVTSQTWPSTNVAS